MADRVGFIGLGEMGLPMVKGLSDAGIEIVAYDVSAAARNNTGKPGGVEFASSSADVASKVAVLFRGVTSATSAQAVHPMQRNYYRMRWATATQL
jgi:3-hydroxyisobutyrate dehydrogenase-like beta-hydroxyacid dehydrogenase